MLSEQTSVVAIIIFILIIKTLHSEGTGTSLTGTCVEQPGFESRLSDFSANTLNHHTIYILCQKSDPKLGFLKL